MPTTHEPAFTIATVCLGNICRSPMAASVLSRKLAEAGVADAVSVESFGTAGWHAGEGADPRAVRVLQEHGYDGRHVARRVTVAAASGLDLILAMDSANYSDLRTLLGADLRLRMFLEFHPALAGIAAPDPRLDTPDPYYGSDAGFVEVLELLEPAADQVVEFALARLG
ncbi:MAG: low molecular weight phosphotyrosine protein phosphatase [Actinobacteria bacterium]|nr:MAG: low molecular weight phosphotyrosine protein phosphatase [Actinomycetota bacterium]